MEKIISLNIIMLALFTAHAQHNYELYNNGDTITVQSGALLYVQGDLYNSGSNGNIATYNNDGLTQVEGNLYSNTFFQQRGSGVMRLQNNTVNTTERQSINGSYAVRGGQAALNTDDGCFYDLELANSQGIVYLTGTGNIADVKNSIDFNPSQKIIDGMTISAAPVINRIITHDVGATGTIVNPANGSDYTAVFGMMNPSPGMGNYKNVSANLSANTTELDNGYIQGKHRRAINNSGGEFGFPLGLEPSTSNSAARGIQYNVMTFTANTYDVITGYFQQGQDNTAVYPTQCNYTINQYYGQPHGQWIFNPATAGTESYDMTIYPQDYLAMTSTNYFITKDNAATGEGCGTDPTGLTRTGFSGFSSFGFAGDNTIVPIKLVSFTASKQDCNVILKWKTATETNFENFEVEYSTDKMKYYTIGTIKGGNVDGEYLFNHMPGTGNAYYRLKLIDKDGKYIYSNIVFTNITCNKTSSITLFPNPSYDYIHINGLQKGDKIQLFDPAGRLLFSKNTMSNQVKLDLAYYAAGIYIMIINFYPEQVLITKIIKMR